MAAYAALASLMNLIEQIQTHPRPPVTLDEEQAESLKKRIAYFQEFLEAYNSHYANQEMEQLMNSITDTAYAAEDFIESCVFNQIVGQSTRHYGETFISLRDLLKFSHGCSNSLQSHIAGQILAGDSGFFPLHGVSTEDEANISYFHLYRALWKLIEHMDLIKKAVMEIKDKMGTQHQLQIISTTSIVSSKSPSTDQNTMVGFDDVLREILDKLTGQPSDRQIIPIVGMGGVGKTTLARNVFKNQLIVEHFDICSWVTISQEYNIREILSEVLLCLPNKEFDYTNQEDTKEDSLIPENLMREKTEEELKEMLYKGLFGRRYLIIMDDLWSDEVWEKIKLCCPDNKNGSRIIVTTRLSNLALYLSGSLGIEVDFLDQDNSWSLLCKTVFGEEDCPPELKDIGTMIAKNCKGLPLSIVVIGGLLANFKQEREYWEFIAEDLSSNVNLEDNEMCLKILYKSYEQLPVHLKACFLYLGVFPEDRKIRVSELIRLWAAEGFLKPISGKTLEESAEIYLMDLIDRNLILVAERGSFGKLKFCNIHDLLRDLCVRQAEKEKFLFLNTPIEAINAKCRNAIHQCTSKEKIPHCLRFDLDTRSLISYLEEYLPLVKFRLLRVLHFCIPGLTSHFSLETLFQLVNLRYLAISPRYCTSMNCSSVSLWNLQTLIIDRWYNEGFAPPDIWKMHRLRHVKFCNFGLLDPPNSCQIDGQADIVLENLQTLVGIQNFQCSEEVVKRIPNVRKLVTSYIFSENLDASEYCLDNLFRLQKLESFGCYFIPDIQIDSFGRFSNLDGRPSHCDLLRNVSFPHALKKLTLRGTSLFWEDMSTKIGSLPHLQVLKLKAGSFIGPRWETIEGQFPNLKYLLIESCIDLECWIAESSHFPSLEHLVLEGLHKLKEIPSGVGEIPTLESIHLIRGSDSAIISAEQILTEQQELGNERLHVHV